MNDSSYIEINKTALKNNINFIQKIIGDECELVSVIKGNAYGHGLNHFAPVAYDVGIRSFAVFSSYEANTVLQAVEKFDRLIIMGFIDPNEIGWAIENGIEIFVFDLERLENAITIARENNKKAKIHIELETGLNRTGFHTKDLKIALKLIRENLQYLSIEGVCSHLAGAENISNYYRIKKQISNFNRVSKLFHQAKIPIKKSHLACSAAIINYPTTIKSLARIGIMQYGFWPSKEVKMAYLAKKKDKTDPLKRVISWKSQIMELKAVKLGEYIGYGNASQAETDITIAVIPVGYSHGFSRSLSNQGKVLISGTRVDVLGSVNMNMILVDVTNVNNPKKGDEVVLIGEQGNQVISVASFSDLSDQLNYELLTRLPNDIPRKITV